MPILGSTFHPSPPSLRSRLARLAEEEAMLVVLLASLGLVMLVLTPSLLVADSWLTLVAGREVADHGLPRTEALTVLAAGRDWIDQQWGAQLGFYGAYALGGLRLVVLLNLALIFSAFALVTAAARHAGATVRGTLIVLAPALLAAPWTWQIRAQAIALPLFAGVLWLLLDGERRPARRTLLVLPLLVVWANAHGSVVMGASLVALAGVLDLVRRRRRPAEGLALAVGAPLAVLASPYAPDIPRYYHLLLVDPPFDGLIVEWQKTQLEGKTFLFFALAGLAALVFLLTVRRRTWSVLELAVLAATFASGIDAIRGVVWFALAAVVVLPRHLDEALRLRDAPVRRGFNRVLSIGWLTILLVGVGVAAVRDDAWFESEWPTASLAVVAAETADPASRLYPSDKHADWLLWHLPGLRGRIAYDVRFELYTPEENLGLARFSSTFGDGWERMADRYGVVFVDAQDNPALGPALLDEPGARAAYEDEAVAVVVRETG